MISERPQQPAVVLGIKQRADADAVAREHQLAFALVPERDGELSLGLEKHALAELFVEMDPGFGVAMRGEPMAALEQFLAQLGIFVELAFEGDPDVARFVRERLPAAGDVDDRQPAIAERDARLDVNVLIIGPAMRDRGRHAQQSIGWKMSPTGQVDGACDATHALPLSISPSFVRRLEIVRAAAISF